MKKNLPLTTRNRMDKILKTRFSRTFYTSMTHISADVQRITLNLSRMTISGGRTEQHVIIAGFLLRHWLYKWFSQFRSCGTYSVLSQSPSITLHSQFLMHTAVILVSQMCALTAVYCAYMKQIRLLSTGWQHIRLLAHDNNNTHGVWRRGRYGVVCR